jgi:hypothetical protein
MGGRHSSLLQSSALGISELDALHLDKTNGPPIAVVDVHVALPEEAGAREGALPASATSLARSEPVFELKPRDLAEVAIVVRDQRHAERESMRRYLGIEFADRRALALQSGVQRAVACGLRLAEGRDREGGEESIDQGVELCDWRFSAPYRSSATVIALTQMEDGSRERSRGRHAPGA